MCILFLAIDQHRDYPLIICANRDEYYSRPTQAMHYWRELPQILAGRDLKAGGTWLGLNKQGHFAALTNLRTGQQQAEKQSRGELVTKALLENSPIDQNWLKNNCHHYNDFNLVYGPANNLSCFNSHTRQQTTLRTGFHAISNGPLDDVWPKMAAGEKKLEQLVAAQQDLSNEKLLEILKDRSKAADEQLPSTGVSLEWERLLSSIFISSEQYGTRSSSILKFHQQGSIEISEIQYNESGKQTGQLSFECSSLP